MKKIFIIALICVVLTGSVAAGLFFFGSETDITSWRKTAYSEQENINFNTQSDNMENFSNVTKKNKSSFIGKGGTQWQFDVTKLDEINAEIEYLGNNTFRLIPSIHNETKVSKPNYKWKMQLNYTQYDIEQSIKVKEKKTKDNLDDEIIFTIPDDVKKFKLSIGESSTEITGSSVQTGLAYGENQNICRDSTGMKHVAYIDLFNDVWYANSSDGVTWDTKEIIGGTFERAGIVCNGSDDVFVTYVDDYDLKYCTSYDGGSTFTSNGSIFTSWVLYSYSCASDSTGLIHCCGAFNTAGSYHADATNFGSWNDLTSDDSDQCSIGVDNNDDVIIVVAGSTADDLDYFTSDDDFASMTSIDDNLGGVSGSGGNSLSIAFDSQNNYHVAGTFGIDLQYCNGSGSSFDCQEIDDTASYNSNIVVTENDEIYILYSSDDNTDDGDVFRANSTDGVTWDVRVQVPDESSSGYPSVLYSNYPSTQNITSILEFVYITSADVHYDYFSVNPPGSWICDTNQDFENASCWSGGVVPTAGFNVTFNDQGTGDCNITNNTMPQNLGSFTVESGYTGTIYFNPLFAEGNWTGNDDGTQLWNVTNDINISGGTMKIYGDAYNGNNITNEGHGQEWRSINGNITIGSGVTLDGIGLGFPKEVGPGSGFPAGFGGGAGHGGYGGQVRPPSYGYTYGSATEPTSLGSGGGDDSNEATDGTAGGSAIKLHSDDTVTIDGTISMNGVDYPTQEPGAGAGGSVWILSETFAGSGTIDVDGGASYRGGGGGGRIALNWTSSTWTGTLRAEGGTEVSPSDKISQPGTLVIPDNQNLTVNYDVAIPSGVWNFTTFYVTNNAILWVREDNSTTNGTGVTINAVNFTLDSGSNIKGDGTGFKNNQGPGKGDSTGARGSGAGHGGIGGADGESSPGGSTYGSETEPTSLGSGGGDDTGESQYGGFGGGAVYINSTNITINGDITMIGTNFFGEEAGGGAGGSVYLRASDYLTMSGSINVDGGDGHPTLGGCGGGGRIALYGDILSLSGSISNDGGDSGSQDGSGGTVYINATTSITDSGTYTTTGYNGGNITFNDTLLTLTGTYTATGTNDDASILLDYTDCDNTDYSGATFSPTETDLSGCSADTCTCAGINTNWEINMEDYCNLTEPCDLGTGNITWTGASGYFNCSAALSINNDNAPPSNTIFYVWDNCVINHN